MYNRYVKLYDFKDRCITDGIHSAAHYKNMFYKFKNTYITKLIITHSELVSEWHIEFRSDEAFYIIAFTINGEEFRFHQKFKDISKIAAYILNTVCADKKTENCQYYHDDYPDTHDYELFHKDAVSIDKCMSDIFKNFQ